MRRLLGIDLAITADHRACLTDATGRVLGEWRFRTTRTDLEELHRRATDGLDPDHELIVVLEPTSSSWVAPSSFLQARGAHVHMVPPEQSADLRRYYAKHVKNDRIDAALLARLPLLHPEGLHEVVVPAGAQGTLKRLVNRRARLVSEVAAHRLRIRSLLHLAMPGMSEALGELGKGAMQLLERAGDPRTMQRLGPARLSAMLIKATRGAWREPKAREILLIARAAIELWDGLEGCDFAEVADDLATEVRLVRALDAAVDEADAKAAGLLAELDPGGLHLSMPGFAERTATTVAGRLGDTRRFRGAAQVRSFVGMIPGTNQSGQSSGHPPLTKAGDRVLRTTLWLAADAARKDDPQLARIYHSQMTDKGNHHTKAVCAVATALASRLTTVLREQRPYQIRDIDGTPVDVRTARAIIAERYTVTPEVRARRRQGPGSGTKRRPIAGVRSEASPPPPPIDRTPEKDATQVRIGA